MFHFAPFLNANSIFQVGGLEVVFKEPKVVASPLVFEATKEQIFAEMEASNRD